MNLTFIGNTAYTDAYIETYPVCRSSQISSLRKLELVSTNQSEDLGTFYEAYEEFEKTRHRHITPGSRHIYGNITIFMLDKERDRNDLIKISKEVSRKYADLPYYSFYSKEGNGHYLVFYFCQRYYYPKGRRDLYDQDVWLDKKTKRYAKAHSENAYLAHRKYEKRSDKKVHYSKKMNCFNLLKTAAFKKKMQDLKVWYCKLLQQLFDLEFNNNVRLKRINFRGMDKMERIAAIKWNGYIKKAEETLNKHISILRMMGCEEYERGRFNVHVGNICRNINEDITKRKFRDGRVYKIKYKIGGNRLKDDYIKCAGESLSNKIDVLFNDLVRSKFPSYFMFF